MTLLTSAYTLTELLALALRAGRRTHHESQRDFAARAGLSKSAVARLETGDGSPTLATAEAALRAAGLALTVVDDDGQVWLPGFHAIDGDLRQAGDRSGRRLPAHWYEDIARHEPPWRIWKRINDRRPALVNDQPWTYYRDRADRDGDIAGNGATPG